MPTEYVETGPPLMRDGKSVVPMAPLYRCEGCGYVGAPFGVKRGDDVLSYCGWRNGPVCIGKGEAEKDPH